MDGDFPPHELPPPGGGIQLQVSPVLDLETIPGDIVDFPRAMSGQAMTTLPEPCSQLP